MSDRHSSGERRRRLAEQMAEKEQRISEIHADLEHRRALVSSFKSADGNNRFFFGCSKRVSVAIGRWGTSVYRITMKQGKGPKRIRQGASSPRSPTSSSRLERVISEAIVDYEPAMGLFTMVEEYLRLPSSTIVLGIQVNVQKVEINDAGRLLPFVPEAQRSRGSH